MNPETIEHSQDSRGRQLSVLPSGAVATRQSLVERSFDKVIPKKNRFLGLVWLLALGGVAFLFSNIQGAATQFYGIAESRSQSISFQYPVEIVAVPVVEGEQVSQDANLLQVRRYDLDLERAVLDQKINEIKAQQLASNHKVDSEIQNLRAERAASIEALNTRIGSLQSTYRLNQSLASSLRSDSSSGSNAEISPLLTKISGLQAERKQMLRLYESRIELLNQKRRDLIAPDAARIAELRRQRDELQRQSQALLVKAPFSGSVGSVMSKPGEQVAAFSPVISIHGASTRQIKGYIHEAVINDIKVGQTVWIEALGAISDIEMISGQVESLGTRIVEYPDRLKRSFMVSAWGREVVIRVDQNNPILLGEKVRVSLNKPVPVFDQLKTFIIAWLPISTVRAWKSNNQVENSAIDIRIDGKASDKLEASGMASVSDNDTVWMVSDEHSELFELSVSGEVVKRYPLKGNAAIDDAESISRDGSNIYLLASLSYNRAQKLAKKRRKLVRLQINNSEITSSESIDLYRLLAEIGKDDTTEPSVSRFLKDGINSKTLDIEAHAVVAGVLYLGFKAPLDTEGNTLLLNLGSVDAIFAGNRPAATIWQKLKLIDPESGEASRLSEFALSGSVLYLLSVNAGGKPFISSFWKYDLSEQKLTLVTQYPDLKAEAMSVPAKGEEILIAFDGGGRQPSKILRQGIKP